MDRRLDPGGNVPCFKKNTDVHLRRMDSFGKRSVQHNLDLDFFVGDFGNRF